MTAKTPKHTNSYDLSWLHEYRHITVIGLGMSGIGVVEKLAEHGIDVYVQDSRKQPPGESDLHKMTNVINCQFGGFDQQLLLESDLLIISPGVSLQTPEIQQAIAQGIEVTGDVDIVTRSTHLPLIAITGSNGKSTVTELVGELAKAHDLDVFVGGNIGRSCMEMLDNSANYDLAVLEVSSYQLETTKAIQAHSSVVLNVSPDHLDRYDGFEDYASTKLSVYTEAKNIVWNRQDKWLQNVSLLSASKQQAANDGVISFGIDVPSNNHEYGLLKEGEDIYFARGTTKICHVSASQLIGDHNHLNVLAALALLSEYDLDNTIIEKTLKTFAGLKHRMQKVRELDGVVWINDSKATNIGATESALMGLGGRNILLAGGQGKGADFAELTPVLEQYVKHVFLFGEDSQQMYSLWKDQVSCSLVDSLEHAVSQAHELAISGDAVLLAPACASFDMFASFEQRGERFMQLVEAL